MSTNRTVGIVAAVVAALLSMVAFLVPSATGDTGPSVGPVSSTAGSDASAIADRRIVPIVGGSALADASATARPPHPTQWGRGQEPIPSNTWWSSAVTGPGATSLWPQPLALRIEDGRVAIASPERTVRPDGSDASPLEPAVILDLGTGTTTAVVDHGPLHVTLRLERPLAAPVSLTLVQGSPLVEIDTTEPIPVLVPGLDTARVAIRTDGANGIDTSHGAWLVAGDGVDASATSDGITVAPGPSGRLALGPIPGGAGAEFDAAANAVASHPLEGTGEDVTVDRAGVTTQVLSQRRRGASNADVGLWALQPHHRRFAARVDTPFGSVPSSVGDVPVIGGSQLRLRYPAVPVLWSALAAPESALPDVPSTPVTVEGSGSYFAGKAAYGNAARADVFRSAGVESEAATATATAMQILDRLVDPGAAPTVHWDDRWGSVIIEPAEFGAGDQLNDHQLQYGYWVAAAAHLAEVDLAAAERYRDTIDLLVADFAGASTVPGTSTSLPSTRTWSPYEGHSWSSGTAPFADGNNLESSSESTFAWWAAARWFVTTGRPQTAEVFLGRFTIESALTGFRWLPEGDQLPTDARRRPWSGVVWSGKVDLGTWFDAADESALGIRLLPLGPASLARYGTVDGRAAALARWEWCDTHAQGCTARWANLLDSDAAVAGRARLDGPDPEPSTTDTVSTWWRQLWERTSPVYDWVCTPGVVPRRRDDGTVVVLASNPGVRAVLLECRDHTGATRWSEEVRGTTTGEASVG